MHDVDIVKKQENILEEDTINYREFIERLKIEFSDFMRYAESGHTIRHASLRARKQSLVLRNLIKKFRGISLKNDDRINKILKAAKTKIYVE